MRQSFDEGMGLCSECRFRRIIRSSRQSEYLLCEYSGIDPSFKKYPRLPVSNCSAYVPANDAIKREEK